MKQIVDNSDEIQLKESEGNDVVENGKSDDLSEDIESIGTSDDESFQLSEVLDCLRRSDVKGLKKLGTTGKGFIGDRLRQQIWPKLVRVAIVETSPRPDPQTIESHPFYEQVILDVNRSLKRFPPCIGETQRISMQDSLIRLIMRILIKNPDLHYFQGYHDICVTFLMILGEEMAFYVLNKLSKTHFRVFMEKSMESTIDLMDIIPIILKSEDPDLSDHMERAEVGTIFALSWVITWFSHVLPTYEDVARLFDFFIVSHRLMPLYLSVALVLQKHDNILALDCDMASIHHFLTRLPEREQLPIESLIESALDLIDRYPPNEMIKAQEIQKKYRKSLENRKNSLFKKVFNFNYLIQTFISFNLMSVTIFILICAAFYQFYWNQ